jgi:pilus assembly protein Flp/PilA
MISYFKDESGASAAEYALLLGIIAVAMVAAVTLLGTNITAAINNAAGVL